MRILIIGYNSINNNLIFLFLYTMDIKNSLTYKTDRNKLYNSIGDNKYDYSVDGVLQKCLPKILFQGNSILVTFLQLIDLRIIMCLKYIDKLKQFKYITWYD